jgi:hypothetical protein
MRQLKNKRLGPLSVWNKAFLSLTRRFYCADNERISRGKQSW